MSVFIGPPCTITVYCSLFHLYLAMSHVESSLKGFWSTRDIVFRLGIDLEIIQGDFFGLVLKQRYSYKLRTVMYKAHVIKRMHSKWLVSGND